MDPFDVRLQDDELLDEVELTTNLIVAANQSDAHMSVTEIDEILGVIPHPRQGRLETPHRAPELRAESGQVLACDPF